MCDAVGGELAERLRSMTLTIYKAAAARARARGLILADTKFEFGFALDANHEPTAELMLVDEVVELLQAFSNFERENTSQIN